MFKIEWLIAPTTLLSFEQEYWERKPMRISRDDCSYYGDLFSLADMDELISLNSVSSGNVRIVSDGQTTPTGDLLGNGILGYLNGQERLHSSYRGGATLNALAIHERWPKLRELSRQLAKQLSVAAQVNAYLTPPGSRGLRPHYDTHDVIVLQITGAKHWQIFGNPALLPLHGEVAKQDAPDESYLIDEFELQAGDLLYIPRGWKHVARTESSPSLHLTIGLFPLTWADVLMYSLGSTVRRNERFRRSLPLGFAKNGADGESRVKEGVEELLPIVVEDMKSDLLLADVALAAGLGVAPILDGHFVDLAKLSSIDSRTNFRLRPTADVQMRKRNGAIALTFHGKVLTLPLHTEHELRAIITAGELFTAESLSGTLDIPSRIVLLRRLVEEGLITIES